MISMNTFIILGVILCLSYTSIIPLEAGTVVIPIPIPASHSVTIQTNPSSLKDASVAAGITKLNLLRDLKFQFTYTLDTSTGVIEFFFDLEDYGAIKSLEIDWLIANNITVFTQNMTHFQWHD